MFHLKRREIFSNGLILSEKEVPRYYFFWSSFNHGQDKDFIEFTNYSISAAKMIYFEPTYWTSVLGLVRLLNFPRRNFNNLLIDKSSER